MIVGVVQKCMGRLVDPRAVLPMDWARGAGAQGPAPKWGPAVCKVKIED